MLEMQEKTFIERMKKCFLSAAGTALLVLLIPGVQGQHEPQWRWEAPANVGVKYTAIDDDGDYLAAAGFSDDGKQVTVAAFSSDSPMPLWTVEESSDYSPTSLCISANGARVAYAILGKISVYSIDGTLIMSYSEPGTAFNQMEFSADGSRLFAASLLDSSGDGGAVLFFDVDGQALLWKDIPSRDVGVTGRIHSAHVSDDGETILAIFSGGMMGDPAYIVVYDTTSETPDTPLWISQPMNAWTAYSALAANGMYFATFFSNNIGYFTTVSPTGEEKYPEWTAYGQGMSTYLHVGDISDDAGIVAHFGEYWYFDPVYGAVEIFDGADGSLIWSDATFECNPKGDLSGNGTRLAYCEDRVINGDKPRYFVFDIPSLGIFREEPGYGHLSFDRAGETLVLGKGYFRSSDSSPSLCLVKLEDNMPPECTIDSPESGASVAGIVSITGTYFDEDDSMERVEVITPEGLETAELDGGSSGQWNVTIDFTDVPLGPFTIKARPVDARYKYGVWSEVTVTVEEAPPTATPGVTPTPTPQQTGLRLHLILPDDYFHPGDTFYLQSEIDNYEQPLHQAALIVVLEVHGAFFFWPSWRQWTPDAPEIDFAMRSVPVGTNFYEIIPTLIWPTLSDSQLGLLFYGVLATPDLSGLLTDIDVILWGYGP